MKVSLITLLALVSIPAVGWGMCNGGGCSVLSFTVKHCQPVSYKYEPHGVFSRNPGKPVEASVNGVELKIGDVTSKPVPCYNRGNVFEAAKDAPRIDKVFMRLRGGSCSELIGQKIEKYYAFKCCDTHPAQGDCVVPVPVVSEIPADLNDRKVSEVISLSDPRPPLSQPKKNGPFKGLRESIK